MSLVASVKSVFIQGMAARSCLQNINHRAVAHICRRASVSGVMREFHSVNRLPVSQTDGRTQKVDGDLQEGQEARVLKLESKPPEDQSVDWIGPADPDSNLRPRKYFIPEDETPTEQAFRIQQEETFKWNQQFWANHNKLFSQSKERFIQRELTRMGPTLEDGTARRLSPEHLSVFYRKFLEENHNKHKQYNKDWYRKNIRLLWPAFKVFWIRMFLKRKPKKSLHKG